MDEQKQKEEMMKQRKQKIQDYLESKEYIPMKRKAIASLLSVPKEDREDFEESVRQMLEGTIRQAVAEFEKLPLEQDLSILRNILYEGVKLPLMRGENDDKRSI